MYKIVICYDGNIFTNKQTDNIDRNVYPCNMNYKQPASDNNIFLKSNSNERLSMVVKGESI